MCKYIIRDIGERSIPTILIDVDLSLDTKK